MLFGHRAAQHFKERRCTLAQAHRVWALRALLVGGLLRFGPNSIVDRNGGFECCHGSGNLCGRDDAAHAWRFADDLVQTIAHLHQPELFDTDMMACVFAANQVCKHMGFDLGGSLHRQALAPSVAARLGGKLQDILDDLGDISFLVEEATVFSKL